MSNLERAPTQVAAPDTADEHDRTLAPSRLLLVRHGESTWNAERRIQGQLDPPLSDRGVAQAQEVAERFAGHRLEALYSSDLRRAWQTPDPIGQAAGPDPIPIPGLREIPLGAAAGQRRAQRP